MKYCMKCGTLLEDSHERCIGCGSDVTQKDSYSLFPPEMAKSIEIEKKESKSQMGLIIAMIAVFVLLVAVIAVFIVFNAKNNGLEKTTEKADAKASEQVEESVATEPEETEVAEVEAVEEMEEPEEKSVGLAPLQVPDAVEDNADTKDTSDATTADGGREIKDSAGKYYSLGSVSDAGGYVMFNTIFPEDFSEKAANISYDVYSTRYPESLTYIVGNKDGNVQFTYMSPQHYWYRKSDYKGMTRSNERDIDDYMQFLTYSGAEGYIEALIKQSYTDIKGFKLIDKEELSSEVTESITKVSKDHTTELLGDIGDYAKIGSDTVYAAMQAECDANIYHYEATSRHGNTIYMDFYVPVIANTLGYVTDIEKDKGEIVEWLIPEFVAFEAGNEELYNLYKDDYKMFIYNSKLTDEFFYMNDAYSKVIEDAVKVRKEPYKLNAEKLKAFHEKYNANAEINAFGKGVREALKVHPSSCTEFSGAQAVVAGNSAKVGFFAKDKNKVFISPSENEYPGSDYVDLKFHEGTASASEESSDSSSESE